MIMKKKILTFIWNKTPETLTKRQRYCQKKQKQKKTEKKSLKYVNSNMKITKKGCKK